MLMSSVGPEFTSRICVFVNTHNSVVKGETVSVVVFGIYCVNASVTQPG